MNKFIEMEIKDLILLWSKRLFSFIDIWHSKNGQCCHCWMSFKTVEPCSIVYFTSEDKTLTKALFVYCDDCNSSLSRIKKWSYARDFIKNSGILEKIVDKSIDPEKIFFQVKISIYEDING